MRGGSLALALLLAGFILLFFQGISEIIKKVAVMRGLIPDTQAQFSSHGEPEIDEELLAEAGFVQPGADDNQPGEPRK